MTDMITFGEAMVRLSPPDFMRLEQTTSLDVTIGGAELNVAVGLSRLGLKAGWVSKLPRSPLGRLIRNKAREQGVDTENIVWEDEGRVGLYFLEFGASPRGSAVLYDRANSSISRIRPEEVDWKGAFREARLFHVTGITPALSASASETTAEALRAAKEAGCSVSFDLNYRAKLWSPQQACETLTPFMDRVDVLMTTEEDTFKVFGIKGRDYQEVAGILAERFQLEVVAITLRETPSVWRNQWTAVAYSDGRFYTTREVQVEVVDRVGAGDSFAAGFLYGYMGQRDVQKGLDYGVAFSALKHSFPGDFNWCTKEELDAQVKGTGLRIRR